MLSKPLIGLSFAALAAAGVTKAELSPLQGATSETPPVAGAEINRDDGENLLAPNAEYDRGDAGEDYAHASSGSGGSGGSAGSYGSSGSAGSAGSAGSGEDHADAGLSAIGYLHAGHAPDLG